MKHTGQINKVELSIIVVSYNCAEVIQQCIESVLTFCENAELIVVDNNSTDGTRDILSLYSNRCKMVLNNTNEGFTKGCNIGIEKAEGEFLMLLNPDAYFVDNSAQLLVNELKKESGLGAVAPNLYFPDGSVQNYIRTFPFISGIWVEHFVPSRFWNKFPFYRKYTCQGLDLSKKQYLEQPAGAAIVFRSQFSMDETYFIYGSDVALCKDVYEAGMKVMLVPEAKVYHHQSKGGTENSNVVLKMFLQLDALYGYGAFFHKYNSRLYFYCYRVFMGISLALVAGATIFSSAEKRRLKFRRLQLFIEGKNFRYYSKQHD